MQKDSAEQNTATKAVGKRYESLSVFAGVRFVGQYTEHCRQNWGGARLVSCIGCTHSLALHVPCATCNVQLASSLQKA